MRGLHLQSGRHFFRQMVHNPYFWLVVGFVLFVLLVYLMGLNEAGTPQRLNFDYYPYPYF